MFKNLLKSFLSFAQRLKSCVVECPITLREPLEYKNAFRDFSTVCWHLKQVSSKKVPLKAHWPDFKSNSACFSQRFASVALLSFIDSFSFFESRQDKIIFALFHSFDFRRGINYGLYV